MRFSSEPTCMIDDRVAAPRGLGMLVFNVEGEKMKGATPDDMDCNAQCFEVSRVDIKIEGQLLTLCLLLD